MNMKSCAIVFAAPRYVILAYVDFLLSLFGLNISTSLSEVRSLWEDSSL
jgi:hypothetical protein